MNIDSSVLIAAVPAIAGWVLAVERRLSSLAEIAKKYDKVLDTLLENKLAATNQKGS